MVKKVEKPLTPKVLKDVYLFVSQLEAINFDISLPLQKGVFGQKRFKYWKFWKIFCNVVFMLRSFVYYISRECNQDLSVSTKTTQQMHQLKTEA